MHFNGNKPLKWANCSNFTKPDPEIMHFSGSSHTNKNVTEGLFQLQKYRDLLYQDKVIVFVSFYSWRSYVSVKKRYLRPFESKAKVAQNIYAKVHVVVPQSLYLHYQEALKDSSLGFGFYFFGTFNYQKMTTARISHKPSISQLTGAVCARIASALFVSTQTPINRMFFES